MFGRLKRHSLPPPSCPPVLLSLLLSLFNCLWISSFYAWLQKLQLKKLLSCEQTPSWIHPSLLPSINLLSLLMKCNTPYSRDDYWTMAFINQPDVLSLTLHSSSIPAFSLSMALTTSRGPIYPLLYFYSLFHPPLLTLSFYLFLQSQAPSLYLLYFISTPCFLFD